jgi:hypothetical protein
MVHQLKTLFTRALLAFALAGGAGAALAGPTWHVALDTTAFAGSTGYLGLTMLGLPTSAPASATVSHFAGDFAGVLNLTGDASGSLAGGAVIGNSQDWNEFASLVNFGGLFNFDVQFDVAGGPDGTTFGVALYDDNGYFGANGNLVEVQLEAGAVGAIAYASPIAQVTQVAAVPEPGGWLLLATGLSLMTLALGRRQQG